MTVRSSFPIALALVVAPVTAFAQNRSPASPAPTPSVDAPKVDAAFEYAPRQPDTLVTLSLENAELPELVRTISEMTGRRFVIATSSKSFQATVVSPQKVTVAEAYQVFLSVLAANHLTVVPHGRFLKIVDAQDAVHLAPVHAGEDTTPAEERFITYVHRVKHVSADDVASGVLSKLASHDGAVIAYGDVLLITDTATNVHRLMSVLDEIDVAQAEDKVWLEPLQYVASSPPLASNPHGGTDCFGSFAHRIARAKKRARSWRRRAIQLSPDTSPARRSSCRWSARRPSP